MAKERRPTFRFTDIYEFVSSLYGPDLHAKRVYSLANATLGVMSSAALGVQTIGAALAKGKRPANSVKANVDYGACLTGRCRSRDS